MSVRTETDVIWVDSDTDGRSVACPDDFHPVITSITQLHRWVLLLTAMPDLVLGNL